MHTRQTAVVVIQNGANSGMRYLKQISFAVRSGEFGHPQNPQGFAWKVRNIQHPRQEVLHVRIADIKKAYMPLEVTALMVFHL
jgi:hypothetical protein